MPVQPADADASPGSPSSSASLVVYVWEVIRIGLVLPEIYHTLSIWLTMEFISDIFFKYQFALIIHNLFKKKKTRPR